MARRLASETRITAGQAAIDSLLDAFADVHTDVRIGPRRVVSRRMTASGRVGLVVGGASEGPVFARLVGGGLADSAAIGDRESPPAPSTCLEAIRAASFGHGVVVVIANRYNEVLNFGLAATMAEEDGVQVCLVRMTDDVVSAPRSSRHRRLGHVGAIVALRAAAAAAAQGDALNDVERIALIVNLQTRSMGLGAPPSATDRSAPDQERLQERAVRAARRILAELHEAGAETDVLLTLDVSGTSDPWSPYLVCRAVRGEVERSGIAIARITIGAFGVEGPRHGALAVTMLTPGLGDLIGAHAQSAAPIHGPTEGRWTGSPVVDAVKVADAE